MIDGATINASLVADGCRIGKGSIIENSVIGLRCVIGEGVTIKNTIIMGGDYMETPDEVQRKAKEGLPCVGIGAGSWIEGAILAKNARIGRHVQVVNNLGLTDSDDFAPCHVRDGISIVTKDAVLPDGWTMRRK